jgi:sacsin
VSGSHLVIFDPHCTNLPNISSANPGKKINFVEAAGRAAARACAGQLAPYQGAFGCDLTSGKPWHGTLFRFPLRTAQLAACSNISKQVSDLVNERCQAQNASSDQFLLLLDLNSFLW